MKEIRCIGQFISGGFRKTKGIITERKKRLVNLPVKHKLTKSFNLASDKIICFVLNLILLLLAYGILYRGTFNGDTLDAMTYPDMQSVVFVGSGRYLFALAWEIAYKLGINMGKTAGANTILTVCLMALSATIIAFSYLRTLYKRQTVPVKLKEVLIVDSVVLISFLNLLSLELLFFSAYALMPGMACLFLALSVSAFADKRYMLCGILLACTVMVYQSYIGMFIVYTLLFVFVEHSGKLTWQSFFKSAAVVAGAGSLCIIDVLSTRILTQVHVIGGAAKELKSVNLLEIFCTIVKTQISIWRNEYSLSTIRFLPFILLSVAAIVILSHYVKNKRHIGDWIYLIMLVTVGNLSTFAVLFGGYLYVPPRVLTSYWAFISAVILLALYVTNKVAIKNILFMLVNLITLFHIINANVIISDLYVSNALDKNYILSVEKCIKNYEKETGREVSTIGIVTDMHCDQYWVECIDYYNFNINERCVSTDWHFDMLLRFYTKREYQKVKIPETVYEEHFEGKDWDYFDASEQLVFIDDQLYLAIY